MTQTLRRERSQKFMAILEEKQVHPLEPVIITSDELRKWRTELAHILADASLSISELRTDETAAAYNVTMFRGDFHDYPEHLWGIAECLRDVWQFRLPEKPKSKSKGQYAFYCQSMDALKDACGEFGVEVLVKVHEEWKSKFKDGIAPYTVAQPTSLVNVCAGKAREMREGKTATSSQPIRTS